MNIHNMCLERVFFGWKNGREGVAALWLMVFLNDGILKPSSQLGVSKGNTPGLRFDDFMLVICLKQFHGVNVQLGVLNPWFFWTSAFGSLNQQKPPSKKCYTKKTRE